MENLIFTLVQSALNRPLKNDGVLCLLVILFFLLKLCMAIMLCRVFLYVNAKEDSKRVTLFNWASYRSIPLES